MVAYQVRLNPYLIILFFAFLSILTYFTPLSPFRPFWYILIFNIVILAYISPTFQLNAY